MKRVRGVVLVSALAVAACSEPTGPSTPQGPSVTVGNPGDVLPVDHPPVVATGGGAGGGGEVGGGAGGGGGDGVASAWSQRLTVRQLANSMPVALGGNTWQVGAQNGFDARRATLGEPDYIAVVDENLEPSALYLKFMGDAARDGCTRAANADASLAQSQRTLTRFVGLADTVTSNRAGVDENLRYLKLRFHGVKVQPGDDAPIAGLRTLFDTAVKAAAGTATPTQAHVKEGWRAVCVALLTAPEYHLY
ncbi:MAG: hypothetical protein AB1730_16815 [Myxococcota bacterium]|jgi:hypothetical protein